MKHLFLAAAAALSSPRPPPPRRSSPPTACSTSTTGRYVDHPAILIGDDGQIQQIGSARLDAVAGGHEAYRPSRRDSAPRPHRHARPSDQPRRDRRLPGPQIYRQLLAGGRRRQCRERRSTPASPPSATSARATSTMSRLQQAIDGGWIEGPRIVPATYALGATGGHCDDTRPAALLTTRRGRRSSTARRRRARRSAGSTNMAPK